MFSRKKTESNSTDVKDEALIKREKVEKKLKLDVDSLIRFHVSSRYEKIQRKNESQKIPLMMTVLAEEVELDEERPGLDLIVMIDVSGSMQGQKIELVKKTLLFILDQLCDIDRLGLTKFSNNAQIIKGLTPMTKHNKEEFRKVINEIHAAGGTNIQASVEQAMELMLNRKEVNETTALFMLSDGQDTCGGNLEKLKKFMEAKDKELKKKKMEYKFHSFGYGSDHDENWLTAISNFKNGNFYYIKEIKMINECFVDCLGSLLSIIAKDAKINVFLEKNCVFVRKFGESWKDKEDKKQGVVLVDNIISDNDKDYVAEIEVGVIPKDLKEIKVALVMLNYNSDSGESSKSQTLILEVVDDDQLGEINQRVEETVAKVEAGEEIKIYEELRGRGQYDDADKLITHFRNKVKNNNNLKMEYREKILDICEVEKLQDGKFAKQNYKVMCEDAYAPGFSNFKSQRAKAKKMLHK